MSAMSFSLPGRVFDEGAAADPARDQPAGLDLAERRANAGARGAEMAGKLASVGSFSPGVKPPSWIARRSSRAMVVGE